MHPPTPWLTIEEPCTHLAISRSTRLCCRQRDLLRTAHHWMRKNPAAPRSGLLWHRACCSAGIGAGRAQGAAPMPALLPPQAADYVLLHRDTGTALYATRATEVEIQQANDNLRRAGNRNRYVAARHLMDHLRDG